MRTLTRCACVLFSISAVLAERGVTPIRLELELVALDRESGKGQVRIDLSSDKEAPGTEVTLILTAGVRAETTEWKVDLVPGKVQAIFASFELDKGAGNVAVTARATKVFAPDDSWGDIQSILLRADPETRLAATGWRYTEVPVLRQLEPGTATVLSSDPVKIPAGSWATTLASTIAPPSKAVGGKLAGPPADSPFSQFTVTGRFRYPDRAGVDRDGTDVLMELRRGDGSAIPGSNLCYTNADGTFSCSFVHPGSSMRLRIFSYTNLDPGPSRLGVFTPGCGDALGCAYSQDSPAFTCAAGTSCDLGTLGWTFTEPWMGAMQMTEDMIRTFEKLVAANLETPQTRPLPGRIVFPSANSPRYHLGGPDDDWIDISYPFQGSADVTVHEYGHAVMRWEWSSFTPSWPSGDCPIPHLVGGYSGPGCGLSEGFADFWSWFGNEFYDGDYDTTDDGPIYNDPSFSVNFETRSVSWLEGDGVEGNVAALLGDLFDGANDGPTPGAADRVSDGIRHIWHIMSEAGHLNFREWYDHYIYAGHDPGPFISIAQHNTIDYLPSAYDPEDVCPSAYLAQPTPWANAIFVPGATTDSTDPVPPCGNGSRAASVFYKFNSGGPGTLTIDTFGSDYDTILSVWKGTCGAFVPVAGGCNDDVGPGNHLSRVSFTTEAETTYIIMVTSWDGATDWLQVNVSFAATPPPHDACTNAKVIPALIGAWGDADWTHGATKVSSDPQVTCAAGGQAYNSVWYRFTAPYDGRMSFETTGSTYDTVLSIYTAGCEPTLRQSVTCSDNAPGLLTSSAVLNVSKGTTYYILVSSYAPGGGHEYLSTYFLPAAHRVEHLHVDKAPGGNIRLSWDPSCGPYDNNYNIYEGQMPDFSNYFSPICHIGNVYSTVLTPGSGNRFFLLSASSLYAESEVGHPTGRLTSNEYGACGNPIFGQCPALCSHDLCAVGPLVDPSCGACVADICAADPRCCLVGWDAFCISEVRTICDTARCSDTTASCRHGLCVEGRALAAGCDAVGCVSQICAVDPWCCDPFGQWDAQCVSEVTSVCGYRCLEYY